MNEQNELKIDVCGGGCIYFATVMTTAKEAMAEFEDVCSTNKIITDNLGIESAVLRNNEFDDIDHWSVW